MPCRRDAGHMLTADGVLPIALGDNWIYALVPPPDERDDGVLLIDAGPDYEGAWEILDAQLQAAGYSVADVRCVAITHAHLDHCGLAPRWQRQGARIAGAAAELERFAQGENVSRYQAPSSECPTAGEFLVGQHNGGTGSQGEPAGLAANISKSRRGVILL